MSIRLLVLVLIMPFLSQAQEVLITTRGRVFDLESYKPSYELSADGSVLEVRTCPTCLSEIPIDSVSEKVSLTDEKIYHLRRILIPSLKVAFLEFVSSGKITVYRRISQLHEKGSAGHRPRRPSGWADYTEVEQYFLEKDGYLMQVLPAYGSQFQQGLLLKEFVYDDAESIREINLVSFSLEPASLLRVVEGYNARCFDPQRVNEANGLVSFVLVDEREENGPMTVMVNGETLPLNDQVVTFQIPVSTDSKVCIANGTYSKCQVIKGTRHFPVFLEVQVDKDGREVRMKKLHSKRFSNVARKAASNDGP